jgi:hypothetical protein
MLSHAATNESMIAQRSDRIAEVGATPANDAGE